MNLVGSPAFRFGKMPGIVAVLAFVAQRAEEPEPILLDRAADAAGVVPLLEQHAGRGQAGGLQRVACSCCRPCRC